MNLNFELYVYQIPAILIAMTIHEIVKARITVKLGDSTPKSLSRLTLNPLKHVEIIGFLCMLIFGYGWSLPTETNPLMYKDRKRGTLITYVAPSLVNMIVGILFVFIALLFNRSVGATLPAFTFSLEIYNFLIAMARYNVALALFNIIPVYPLDGWRALSVFLSANTRVKMSNYEKIFQIILILLLTSGILGMIFDPMCNAILQKHLL